MNRQAYPILFIILAALSSSLMVTCAKLGVEQGETIPALLFWRSFLALLIMIPLFTYGTRPRGIFFPKVKTKRFGLHLLRGCVGFIGIVLFFYCASKLTLTISSVLFMTVPLFVPFVAYFWKREKIVSLSWIGMIVGFIGVVLVIQPGRALFHMAALFGLLSGIVTAVGQYASHQLSKTESSQTINFYFFLICGVLSFFFSLLQFDNSWSTFTPFGILLYILIGISGYAYVFFLTLALKHGHPVFVTSFVYVGVIFTLILDWAIWGTVADPLTFLGILFIVGGVVLKVLLHKQKS